MLSNSNNSSKINEAKNSYTSPNIKRQELIIHSPNNNNSNSNNNFTTMNIRQLSFKPKALILPNNCSIRRILK